ncbi:MAG: hypothetical protein FWE85_01915 [Clostridiales bacterium]|nr:hypothetical protein [Clostridiales bacterium]
MQAFRNIVVKDKTFLWTYIFDDDDLQIDSNIIIKDCDRKGKLVIQLLNPNRNEHGYCPFNMGLPALKDSEEVVINLNRPKYIAEILEHILDCYLHDDGFNTTGHYDGLKILTEMGYVFNYHLTV